MFPATPTLSKIILFVRFHVEVFEQAPTKGSSFHNRDIVILDGQVDNMEGGSISVKNSNGSFTDLQMTFSEQYKRSIGSNEWEANVTATFKKANTEAATTLSGHAIFFNENGLQCHELVWYKPSSGPYPQDM